MLPCNTTILLGLDINLLFGGTQASLTLLQVIKRYCKEMPDLEKNRDLNQVSWKQEHPHNLASSKNRAGHTSRPQTETPSGAGGSPGSFTQTQRAFWGIHTLPGECLCLSCSGVPWALFTLTPPLSLSLLFPPCYLLISKSESDGQGVTVMLLASPSLSRIASWPVDSL